VAVAFSVAVETEWLLGPGQAPAGVAEAIGVSFRKLFRSTSKVRARSTRDPGPSPPGKVYHAVACTTPDMFGTFSFGPVEGKPSSALTPLVAFQNTNL